MKIRKIMLLTMIGLFSVFEFSCSKTGNEKQSLTMSKESKNGKKAEYKKITSAEAKLKNKDALILVYCRSGRRSREAALKLIEKGYTNVIDFGGIKDWNGEVVK